jgi:hypothetical protein
MVLSGCSFIGVRGPTSKGSDCTSNVALPVVDTVAALGYAIMAASAVHLVSTSDCDQSSGGCYAEAYAAVIGIPSGVLGVVLFGGSAIYGYMKSGECRAYLRHAAEVQASQDRMREETMATRDRAWALMKTAAQAARDGDCDHVRMIDGNVRSIDAEFHATVFRRDVAIMRCLEAAPPAASDPSVHSPTP